MGKPARREETRIGLEPFSLKDAPSFIERQFPVGRLSAEAYKERKAVAGQTLTGLGAYWKGRKPLILVRAVVLGSLLPATDDPAKDLEVFLKILAMDDKGLGRRIKSLKASDIDPEWDGFAEIVSTDSGKPRWLQRLDDETLERIALEWFPTIPYEQRIRYCLRPEQLDDSACIPIWREVNAHLGTNARSLPDLVEQLGIARFGHRPKVADTFCGGGSIPFEAARIGCDVNASDLNPIACMLTWGAFNIIGASEEQRAEIEAVQRAVAETVDAEITKLGIEHDKKGNRAKAFLYCLETRCPKTGWMVPLLPSLVISESRATIVKLIPDEKRKTYKISLQKNVGSSELKAAALGTVRQGRLVHPMNPERSGVEIRTIRGDRKLATGETVNNLRHWKREDFTPRDNDVYQERLYCIQWVEKETLDKTRQRTFFAAPTSEDLEREKLVQELVSEGLVRWQELGLVSDMEILTGKENEGPIRTNGWTFWHHMFMPRAILTAALVAKHGEGHAAIAFSILKYLDNNSKSCRWKVSQSGGDGGAVATFDSQALRTIFNWANRSFPFTPWQLPNPEKDELATQRIVECHSASVHAKNADLFVTDPPYADSVRYEEITEFFIAWLRKNPPSPFDQWTWDSQRHLAIKGKDEDFRRAMVDAYSAMTRHMPDNGLQVVMFTHQDAGVWADLGAILWAAGLRVTGAWNIVTETQSALKEGNYVQGTICLVLRKRLGSSNARRMEIEGEIEDAVKTKLAQLQAIDEEWQAETLYTDGDLTLAAYAAALEVVTGYSTIDRQPLDRDLYRKVKKGERTMLRDLIDYAESVATNLLVPAGFPQDMWRDLEKSERYYVRMLDMEAKGATKVADFQSFAKSFAYQDYQSLMGSTKANNASLAGAADLKGRMLEGEGFAKTLMRKVLFAVWKTIEKEDPKLGGTTLKTELGSDYWQLRQKLILLADYVSEKTNRTRPEESTAAHELAEALKVDRV